MKIRCYACEQKLDVSAIAAFEQVECPNCQTHLIVPKLFGEMLLEERLGQGTMATVYRAIDITLDRENAVKVLLGTYAQDDGQRDAYLQAARSISQLTHPHIIPIYSAGEVEDEPYIVMQYLGGGSLKERLAKGPQTVDVACGCLYQVILGLEAAARQDILHYDLKPSNILFDQDDNVKVGDFGLSVIAYPDEAIDLGVKTCEVSLTRSWYLAPEVVTRGERGLPAEIYQLGAVMYHTLTGRPPFDDQEPRHNLQARFRAVPTPVRERRPEVPRDLSEMLEAMLSAYPEDRPSSYDEVAQQVKQHRGSQATLYETSRHTAPAAAASVSGKPVFRVPVKKSAGASAGGNRQGGSRHDDIPDALPSRRNSAGAAVWSLRVVLVLLVVLVIVLIGGHLLQASWYESWVRPHLPASSSPVPAETQPAVE